LDNLHRRKGEDETTAGVAVILLLREDFLGEVPGEQQGVIGTESEQIPGRYDGQVGAGGEASLLGGAAVGDELDAIEVIPADAIEVEQGGTLGRGAIGGDAFSFGTELAEQLEEVFAQGVHPAGKVGAVGGLIHALAGFLIEKPADSGTRWA